MIEDSRDWYNNKSNLIQLMTRIISFYDLMGEKNNKQCAEIILKFLETSDLSNTEGENNDIPPAPSSMEGDENSELVKADEINTVEEYPSEEQPVKEEEQLTTQEVVNDESIPEEEQQQEEEEIKKVTVNTVIETTESTPSPNTSPTQKQEITSAIETIKEEETIVFEYNNYYFLLLDQILE